MGKGLCPAMSIVWWFSLPAVEGNSSRPGDPTCVVKRQLHDRSHRLDACGHHLSETKHTVATTASERKCGVHPLSIILWDFPHSSNILNHPQASSNYEYIFELRRVTKNTHTLCDLKVTALSFRTRSLGIWLLQVSIKQPLLVRRPCAHISKKGSRKAQVSQDKEHTISDDAQSDQQRHSLELDV